LKILLAMLIYLLPVCLILSAFNLWYSAFLSRQLLQRVHRAVVFDDKKSSIGFRVAHSVQIRGVVG
jgi:cell division protein FtsL